MKFRLKASLLTGAVVAGSLIGGAPAQANTSKTCIPLMTWSFGDVCFDGNGDKFIMSDYRDDHRRIVVKWVAHDGSGRTGECHDADGAMNGAKICNYNFREGKNNYLEFVGMTRNGAHGTSANISPTLRGYITPR